MFSHTYLQRPGGFFRCRIFQSPDLGFLSASDLLFLIKLPNLLLVLKEVLFKKDLKLWQNQLIC